MSVKAMVMTGYGSPDVLQLREVERPVPKDDEVLIRIHATTVTAGDCEIRRFDIPLLFWLPLRIKLGIIRPRRNTILGQELAGEVEAVGREVSSFKEGDRVFGATGFHFGTYAEHICLPEKAAVAIKPANMNYEEAAAVPVGGTNALFFLRKANIHEGQRVMVYGASGSIGTFAVQIAKHYGAEVTGVCSSANLDMVLSIGADEVIDYTEEDPLGRGEEYDVIFDAVGKSSFSGCVRSLTENGTYLLSNPTVPDMVRGRWTSMTTGKRVISSMASEGAEDLEFLRKLIEEGKLRTVVDRCYPLERIADAHRYVDKGHKKGNVVISV